MLLGVVLTEDVDAAADAALKNVVVSAAAERLREQCISHVLLIVVVVVA